ncbi:DNA-binding response regulator [candidate division KSB1 bacterium]|nr:MAG: DNA-binding response regulator [candidate division KSB1 bacterium]
MSPDVILRNGHVRIEDQPVNLQQITNSIATLHKGSFSKALILIVDDEEDIREMLRYNLVREGYQVILAETGEQALESVKTTMPDLVLLDLMLPGMDGLEVCRQIKQQPEASHIRIVMITAKAEDVDVVVGLESGADDYIIKPFSPRILIARIKNILRKQRVEREAGGEIIGIRELMIHPVQHEVRIGSHLVDLTATEFKILLALARKPGWIFSRKQLVNLVRGDFAPVTMRSVDVHIVRLRNKLGAYGEYIETVRTLGYRFRRNADEASQGIE